MAQLRDIRRRIKSVKNTAQITRAMQLVAASKMKRAQDIALAGRPFAQLMAEVIISIEAALASRNQETDQYSHILLESRLVRKRGILVISPDKGLCGPLVSNLCRQISEIPREEAVFICLGRKCLQFIARTGRQIIAEFPISDKSAFAEIRPAVEMALQAYREGTIDTIEILFTRYVNTLRQEAVLEPLVPLLDIPTIIRDLFQNQHYTAPPPIRLDQRELHFEPNPERILDYLLERFVKREIHQMVLESKASEHSARMVAMKTATDNAKNLVDDLTLQYNKARQASITQEILEIASATMAQSTAS